MLLNHRFSLMLTYFMRRMLIYLKDHLYLQAEMVKACQVPLTTSSIRHVVASLLTHISKRFSYMLHCSFPQGVRKEYVSLSDNLSGSTAFLKSFCSTFYARILGSSTHTLLYSCHPSLHKFLHTYRQ